MKVSLITHAARELDRAVADLYFAYEGAHRFESELTVPTSGDLQYWLAQVESMRARVQAAEMDVFWQDHFSEVLISLRTQMEIDVDRPYKFLNRLTSAIDRLSSTDQRPVQERCSIIESKTMRAGELLQGVLHLLAERSQVTRHEAVDSARVLRSRAEHAALYWSRQGFDSTAITLAELAKAAEAFSHQLTQLPAGEAAPSLSYERILEHGYGLSPDWVLSWYQAALSREQEAMQDLAQAIDGGRRSAPDILQQDLGAYPQPEDMFTAMREYVATAQRESRRYVQLPPGEICTVEPMPELVKQTSPWGAYYGGNVLAGDLSGRVVLHDNNYQQVTRGWLEMMAVHECYPGHHAHRVKTAASQLPQTFKCGYLASAVITEGIAHRSETLLKDIFPEAAYPLFVQYRRVHTTARIKVDVGLFVNHEPLESVYDIYCQEMGLDEKTARAQARAHLLLPGAHVTYYSGMKKLQELQDQLAWDDERFTEAIFGHGFISACTLSALLQLSENERAQIKAFSSAC